MSLACLQYPHVASFSLQFWRYSWCFLAPNAATGDARARNRRMVKRKRKEVLVLIAMFDEFLTFVVSDQCWRWGGVEEPPVFIYGGGEVWFFLSFFLLLIEGEGGLWKRGRGSHTESIQLKISQRLHAKTKASRPTPHRIASCFPKFTPPMYGKWENRFVCDFCTNTHQREGESKTVRYHRYLPPFWITSSQCYALLEISIFPPLGALQLIHFPSPIR